MMILTRPELNLKFEIDLTEGNIVGRCFLLKTNRRVWGWRFKDTKQLWEYVTKQIKQTEDSKLRVIQRREEKKQKTAETKKSIKVGDYYSHTFSYENTSVSFYVVSSIKGNTINLKRVRSVVVEAMGYGSEYVSPGEAYGEEIKARINGEYLTVPRERGNLSKTTKDSKHYTSWGY